MNIFSSTSPNVFYLSDFTQIENFPFLRFLKVPYCQAQVKVQVQVRWRSGKGQESQELTWAILLFLVFTTNPPPTLQTKFFLGFLGV